MAESQKATIGPFPLGMNNRRPDTDLNDPKAGRWLRSAVNVDIDSTGRIKRRQGATKLISGTACHSLWSGDNIIGDDNNIVGFYVDGTSLYCTLNGASFVVRTGLTPGRQMSYSFVNSVVYYSNGVDKGKIIGTTSSDWGLPLPVNQPLATASQSSGALNPGTYRFYYVYVADDGQESGSSDVCTAVIQPTLAALGFAGHRNDDLGTGSITISNLPTVLPTLATSLVLYMTSAGGQTFFKVAIPTLSSVTITSPPTAGQVGRTLNLTPMPAGNIVRAYNARMLVALGPLVYYSNLYAFSLHDPAAGFHQFPEDVTLVMPLQDGVYIVADQTYWLAGDIADSTFQPTLPYGGVPRTDIFSPEDNSVWWMSVRGLCLGLEGGKVTNLQDPNVAVQPGDFGAGVYMERDGRKQTVTTMFGPDMTGMAAQSFLTAEVIRKGTSL